MRAAVLLLVLLAVVAAGGVAFFANRLMAPQPGAVPAVAAIARPVVTGTQVLVVESDVKAGETIGRGALAWQPWPEEAVRGDVISVTDEAPDMEAAKAEAVRGFEGMTARRAILAGEPLTRHKVFKREGAAFMPGAVRPGMRAVSVPVSAETGAGGFILPGDMVDVIVAHDLSKSLPRDMAEVAPRAGIARHAAEVVVSDVRVLAVDQSFRRDAGEGEAVVGKTVTLEVTPQQAAVLSLSVQMGEVLLSLRPLGDEGILDASERAVTDLGVSPTLATAVSLGLGGRDGPRMADDDVSSGPPPAWTVRVNRGGKMEKVSGY